MPKSTMKKHLNTRNQFIHLYNPSEEGLGSYDVHYINAYKKNKKIALQGKEKNNKRLAA